MLLTNEEMQKARQELEGWSGFLDIKTTPLFLKLINRPEKTVGLFTGNQWGKNVNIIKQYILRWLGKHLIEAKNLSPDMTIRTYRFCSEKKPNDTDGGDTNTIYPVLKRMWPKKLIRKDISQRNAVMTLIQPHTGLDFFVEFIGYSQDIQVTAGQQRSSVYLDENCKREFYNEQLPRLMASDGDVIIGMTPALGQVTWQFEDIYERARVVIRTEKVRKRLKERFGEDHPEEEITSNDSDICVIMAATDDNPIYDVLVKQKNEKELELIKSGKHHIFKSVEEFIPVTKEGYIKSKIEAFDEETEDVRRYGIFRQVSGRIFKDFDSCHIISGNSYFPDGIPHAWVHGRGLDYHKHVDWHVGFCALSPDDEMFIYDELEVSPERFVTAQIARMIADKSKDYRYNYSKIDPLASEIQTNTGVSTLDDLNRIFGELKREGIGTGGYWSGWDTKGNRGREEIRKRLKNSRMCGKPFNNNQKVDGRIQKIPTLWVLSNCRVSIDYMKNWRLEEWADRSKLETKEMKETPMQRYSHMNMVWEGLLKEQGFKARNTNVSLQPPRHTAMQYGRR